MKRTLLVSLAILATNISFAQMECTIKGEVINRTSKVLLLRKCSDAFRNFLNNPTRIPVSNGKFQYSFTYQEPEAYEMIFEDELENGSWVPILFFPTDGLVEFRLYPQDDHEKNVIKGGALNDEFNVFNRRSNEIFADRRSQLLKLQRELNSADEYNSPAYKALIAKLRTIRQDDQEAKVPVYRDMNEMQKTHTRYTEKAKKIFVDPYDSLTSEELQWKYGYITNNISLVSYYLIWKDVEMQMKNNALVARLVTSVYPLYEKKYPRYVYTKLVGTQVAGLETVNIGNRFIDLNAPTLAGDTVQLSSVIRNQVALINFWGSWCAPCIAKTRLIAPLYEQYKNKGFSIVGIAREFKSTVALKKRLDKEQYPWVNLVELDDRQNIWARYGISNGVGLMLLVDRDGSIIAIDPTPEELSSILKEKFPLN